VSNDPVPFTELLSDIVDNRGRTCPTVAQGMPLIATNCIVNDRLYPLHEKVRYVSEQTYLTWFRGHPEPGDIIFVCKGSPGHVAMAPDPVGFCIAQDMVAVRADPHAVYPRYLFAVLRSPLVQTQIDNLHVGTLIPHFKKGDFDKLLIQIPDRATQVYVGDMYFELSAKIEVNSHIVSIASDMLAALFAEAAERGEQLKASSVLKPILGGTPSRAQPEFWDGSIPWASAKDVAGAQYGVLQATADSISTLGLESSAAKIVPAGTTLITARGTVGKLARTILECSFNQTCYALIPSDDLPEILLYLSVQDAVVRLMTLTHGTIFATITKQTFDALELRLPSRECWPSLVVELEMLDRVISSKLKESVRLASLRDALLPKLLSGAVPIPGRNSLVKEAV